MTGEKRLEATEYRHNDSFSAGVSYRHHACALLFRPPTRVAHYNVGHKSIQPSRSAASYGISHLSVQNANFGDMAPLQCLCWCDAKATV